MIIALNVYNESSIFHRYLNLSLAYRRGQSYTDIYCYCCRKRNFEYEGIFRWYSIYYTKYHQCSCIYLDCMDISQDYPSRI